MISAAESGSTPGVGNMTTNDWLFLSCSLNLLAIAWVHIERRHRRELDKLCRKLLGLEDK
jgi:hypothetical protein